MPRPSISLTDFIDVVLKSGIPKATKVKQIKRRRKYTPGGDFYKRLRERIIEVHTDGLDKKSLEQTLKIAHPTRKGHYKEALKGYKKWWGNKEFEWVTPPRSNYNGRKIDVVVNPELGLAFKGKPHIVKLYFKADALKKNRAIHIYQMMEETLRSIAPEGAVMCILDVKRGNLFTFNGPDTLVSATLKAELAYIESIWESV